MTKRDNNTWFHGLQQEVNQKIDSCGYNQKSCQAQNFVNKGKEDEMLYEHYFLVQTGENTRSLELIVMYDKKRNNYKYLTQLHPADLK